MGASSRRPGRILKGNTSLTRSREVKSGCWLLYPKVYTFTEPGRDSDVDKEDGSAMVHVPDLIDAGLVPVEVAHAPTATSTATLPPAPTATATAPPEDNPQPEPEQDTPANRRGGVTSLAQMAQKPLHRVGLSWVRRTSRCRMRLLPLQSRWTTRTIRIYLWVLTSAGSDCRRRAPMIVMRSTRVQRSVSRLTRRATLLLGKLSNLGSS